MTLAAVAVGVPWQRCLAAHYATLKHYSGRWTGSTGILLVGCCCCWTGSGVASQTLLAKPGIDLSRSCALWGCGSALAFWLAHRASTAVTAWCTDWLVSTAAAQRAINLPLLVAFNQRACSADTLLLMQHDLPSLPQGQHIIGMLATWFEPTTLPMPAGHFSMLS